MTVHKVAPVPPRMAHVSRNSVSMPGRRSCAPRCTSGKMGLGDAVEEAILAKFGEEKTKRVLQSFRRIREGDEFMQMHNGKGMQVCHWQLT